jgi:hypothetical protein
MAIDYSTPYSELPEVLTLSQCAAWLAVERETLRRMAQRGRGLPFAKGKGDNWFIHKSALYVGRDTSGHLKRQHNARRKARAMGAEAALKDRTALSCPYNADEQQAYLRDEWLYMYDKTRKYLRMAAQCEGELGTWV